MYIAGWKRLGTPNSVKKSQILVFVIIISHQGVIDPLKAYIREYLGICIGILRLVQVVERGNIEGNVCLSACLPACLSACLPVRLAFYSFLYFVIKSRNSFFLVLKREY